MSYGRVMYGSVDDFINNVQFPVMVPLLYLRDSSNLKDLDPFFIPDPKEMTRSVATIADLIDIIYKKLSFKALKEKDLIYIFKIVKMYSEELGNFRGNKEADDYLEKVSQFLQQMERPIRNLSHRFPDDVRKAQGLGVRDVLKMYSE